MKAVKLRSVSDDRVEAAICCDPSHGDREDHDPTVSIAGGFEDKEIGQDGADPRPGTASRIEGVEG